MIELNAKCNLCDATFTIQAVEAADDKSKVKLLPSTAIIEHEYAHRLNGQIVAWIITKK